MSTRSENTVTINQPIEKVHKALLTKEYWEYIVANLSPEAGQVHDFSDNVATLFEVLPTTLLPEAVRAMVSQDLKVKRVVTVGASSTVKPLTLTTPQMSRAPRWTSRAISPWLARAK